MAALLGASRGDQLENFTSAERGQGSEVGWTASAERFERRPRVIPPKKAENINDAPSELSQTGRPCAGLLPRA